MLNIDKYELMALLLSVPLWISMGCQCDNSTPPGTVHLKKRQDALAQLEKGVPMSEQDALIGKFNHHQRRLVELGVFEHVYAEIPIESVPQNIDLGAYLVQQFHVSEKANIARAWLEVGQISPTAVAVELWGTPEQISLMKRFIAKQIDKNQYIWKKLNGEGMINKALTSTD